MKAFSILAGAALASLALTGCNRETILPGERVGVRDVLDMGRVEGELPPAGARAFAAPAQVNHSEWTHRNGTARHEIQHPALGASLSRIWTANIGEGDTRKQRITADPVVSGGRVFTLDSVSTVSAHSTSGALLWSRNLRPAGESSRGASGGGLAIGGGRLFVSTGYGELRALDPATGAEMWEQEFDGPISGAPTVMGDLVYVSTRDARAFAVGAANGRLQWQVAAAPTDSVMVNGAGPAASGAAVVFPFGSAELVTTLPRGGLQIWNATLAGKRLGRAWAGVTDITGDPVIDGNVVYAGSPSGRVAAFELGTGERLWTAREGAMSPVWPAGGSVFLVSDINELVRLDAATGQKIWANPLPFFTNDAPKRRRDIYTHYGPILAGGRLWVGSSDGLLRAFSPETGALAAQVELPGGASTNPVVAGGTLYIVSGSGQLHAYR
ncbi:PQQ-binding-like beta-propeller repeat protein [Roseicyclus sp. F158]|uniref:PQQ-binding-like beta-propeller repeat protein n=1 Tax=Tropicimonas omnivorans TaxID=3075590 RepID=A0ABU3DGS1_9RHOB|nr:PQQ-binding-like beta-propeller repeat protein [Roseicyclus sp. F158]MDT0682753.1 PQQ-binding-like beta-propeller repeat protein [Roseicyclus sp. F158]